MAAMITATINRTCAKQIKHDGQALAFGPMRFNSSHTSVEAVRAYCERLASNDGITNPQIIIETN